MNDLSPDPPKIDPLVDAIDATAIKLLNKIGGDATLSDDESKILVEQVKGFEAIVKWAAVRGPLLPKEDETPKETKFGNLKRRFAAASPEAKRRRGRPPTSTEIDVGAGTDGGEPSASAGGED